MAAKLSVHEIADGLDWDRRVRACPDANIYCGSLWGAYKVRRGAQVRRAVITADGRETAFVQWQERRKGPARFVHVQGGPLLTQAGANSAVAVFAALIDHLDLGRFDLLGVDYQGFETQEATIALLSNGFAPVVRACDHTIEIDLTRDLDAIKAAMEPAWRRGLHKAERNPALTTHFPEGRVERLSAFDDFTAMFAALRQRKRFATTLQPDAFRDIAADDDHVWFLDVRENGERILVRMLHRSAERCTDFYVASNERAMATGAARLSAWRAVDRAKAMNCNVFDFGGVDPASNPAVFQFKRGLCRNVVQNDPLWLYGKSPAVQKIGAILFSQR